ncbi:MAG: ParB/RepB/Spo0J family partition protein [Thaumarchaeota archaeon]|nr:ParB/RepB/Spo0J family partition protein [Nitrososphaerota archaeon]MCL5317113.1 ParB/RepB/Spo0J family partition protein [Nitrososphaerota archaeon]
MSAQRLEQFIEIDALRANRWNCNYMSRQELDALKEGMKSRGPENTPAILVRLLPDLNYEIIDGEQRFKAAKELNWKGLYALLKQISDDDEAKYQCLAMNLAKGRIDPLKLFDLLNEEWEEGSGNLSMRVLEQKYHGLFSKTYIQRVLSLRAISREARDLIDTYRSSGKIQEDFQISLSHLVVLARLKHPKDQLMYGKLMIDMKLSFDELDIQVKNRVEELKDWEKTRETEPQQQQENELEEAAEDRDKEGQYQNRDQEHPEMEESVDDREYVDNVEPPPPLSPKQPSKPRSQKVEEVFTCPGCSDQFLVNYSTKRVLSLKKNGTHLKAVQQDGTPSKMKETCPACRSATASIDYLNHEVQWEMSRLEQ